VLIAAVAMDEGPPRYSCCASAALADGRHLKLKLIFEGREEECLLIRFSGKCYAYINRCVHMPRPLDCEQDLIFDTAGRYLRCSMHGIVYTPETGASVSALCEGERLRAVSIYEENGEVGIADYRVSAVRLARLAGT
jgi:nitrite reductase/ring-hydroxylating ferredoxin subunit